MLIAVGQFILVLKTCESKKEEVSYILPFP